MDTFEPESARGVVPITIDQELRTSFLDYSMSVIVSRALPDVRDGLKPVHRRILYTMHELGLLHNRGFRKSAAVVGDTMGKYHPHGDSAIYDALVRMAQEWSMRYPLVDGQGNFGSIDGDSPAAMRYTEARMAAITSLMLADIEKRTVDVTDNYDGRLKEPTVLPGALPNLLVNGSQGIAVGMATNCPPHNLSEVCGAIVHMIDDPDADTKALMKYIRAPDFPTGGIICGTSGLLQAYRTGRGRLVVRARAVIEHDPDGNRERIVVTELPYQVNKARLIENIAHLVNNKEIEGITDLRDESDRDGMRIVIEVRRGDEPQVILNQLYKATQLQDTCSILMLALVDNVPRVLSLEQMVRYFIEHRVEIVRRRTEYDLEQAEARAHVLEGLLRAIDHIDEIIALIRSSADSDEARVRLMDRFEFSEVQANAILAMRLRRLTGLEREELETEYRDLLKEIERLRMILSSRANMLAEVRRETIEIKGKFGDKRRTEILHDDTEFTITDLIADEQMVVTMSNNGYVKRVPIDDYRRQGRGGKGVTGGNTKNDDFVRDVFVATTHQYMLFFTNQGKVYWRAVHELPKASRTAKGRSIQQVLELRGDEEVTSCLAVRDLHEEGLYVFMATRQGTVKKTPLEDFSRPRTTGINAINLGEGDTLIATLITSGEDRVLLATSKGLAIHFPETDVRSMGRAAAGVRGIRLMGDDFVVGAAVAPETAKVLTVAEKGLGKRSRIGDYRLQARGGKGIINVKATARTGRVVGMFTVDDEDEIVVISTDGKLVRTLVKDIRVTGRNAQGVIVVRLSENEKVAAVAKTLAEDQEQRLTEGVLAAPSRSSGAVETVADEEDDALSDADTDDVEDDDYAETPDADRDDEEDGDED